MLSAGSSSVFLNDIKISQIEISSGTAKTKKKNVNINFGLRSSWVFTSAFPIFSLPIHSDDKNFKSSGRIISNEMQKWNNRLDKHLIFFLQQF